jgi:hypothetical protein
MCSDKSFCFINTRIDWFVEIRAPNRKEARLRFLKEGSGGFDADLPKIYAVF